MSALKDLLRPGDTLLIGTGTGEPVSLIEELIAVAPQFPGLRAIQVMTGGLEQLADATGPAIRLLTPMPGSKTRKAIAEGRAELLLLPMSALLHGVLDGSLGVTGVLMQGRALDEVTATPGLIADVMVPAWETARFRALELNDKLPRIACLTPLKIATAEHIVHSSREPKELLEDPVSEAAARIGELVAEIVPDGATIELGVGRALAGIVAALIAHRRDLAMHTGIVGDAAMRLIEAGCVSRPVRGTAMAAGATAMGTRAYYAWADNNPRIALVDSRLAHNADALAALPRFVAVNGALQIDLQGQVNSISHKGRIVSGVGGSGDFAAAGVRSVASVIVLFSTTPDGSSTIVPQADAVSLPADRVTHVVTEHGVACLRGATPIARARALAAIAAPEHRGKLLAHIENL